MRSGRILFQATRALKMTMQPNSTNALPKQGKTAYGIWLTFPGIHHARQIAQSTPCMDWVCVDCEHGLISLTGLGGAIDSVTGIITATAKPPMPIVRIPATGASTGVGWQIKQALDAGARGIIVPMVGTKAEAEEVAAWSRFPRWVKEVLEAQYVIPCLWQTDMGGYLAGVNDELTIMVQIETPDGLNNVSDIASVPGIDVLFVGPFDLSISLGFPPPSPDPHSEVEKAIGKILKAGHEAGKKVAIYCSSGDQGKQRADQGFDVVSIQSDAAAMQNGLRAEFEKAVGSTDSAQRLY